MRDFLFRGKCKDTGEWLEGNLFYNTRSYFIRRKRTDDPYWIHFEHKRVVPETVGQFIGLLDKDGTKIFEGDIIRYGDITGIINYSTGCYCVKTNKPDWRSRTNPAIDIILNEYPNEIRVIGNIHDNPELLEVKK